MKKTVGVLGIAFCIAGLSGGCDNAAQQQKREQLATIDSLSTVVEVLSNRVADADAGRIEEEADHVQSVYTTIVEQYPDSTDKNFWIKEVHALDQVNSGYQKFLKEKPQMDEQLAYCRKQLKGLKKSLEDDKITAEQAEKYMNDEAQAVTQVNMLISKRVPKAEAALAAWDTTRSHYDSLARTLRSQQ